MIFISLSSLNFPQKLFSPMNNYSSLPPSRTSSRSKKPSNYAKYIEEYQQQFVPKSSKRLKSEVDISNEIQPSSGEQKKGKSLLPCVLPDGRRLNLQILFTQGQISKSKPKPKEKPIQQTVTTQKKPKPQQNNLLSKFLFAFQQIEKNQKEVENDGNKNVANSAELPINQNKKEPKQLKKKEKDQDDKFLKFYQKIKKLDQKFLEVSETLVLL